MERIKTGALVVIAAALTVSLLGQLIGEADASTPGVKCVAWQTDVTAVTAGGNVSVRDVEAAELQSRVAALQAEGYRVPIFVDAEAAEGKFEGALCMGR